MGKYDSMYMIIYYMLIESWLRIFFSITISYVCLLIDWWLIYKYLTNKPKTLSYPHNW
jgi:hypothetical protein